jgi:hypothetical protein
MFGPTWARLRLTREAFSEEVLLGIGGGIGMSYWDTVSRRRLTPASPPAPTGT